MGGGCGFDSSDGGGMGGNSTTGNPPPPELVADAGSTGDAGDQLTGVAGEGEVFVTGNPPPPPIVVDGTCPEIPPAAGGSCNVVEPCWYEPADFCADPEIKASCEAGQWVLEEVWTVACNPPFIEPDADAGTE